MKIKTKKISSSSLDKIKNPDDPITKSVVPMGSLYRETYREDNHGRIPQRVNPDDETNAHFVQQLLDKAAKEGKIDAKTVEIAGFRLVGNSVIKGPIVGRRRHAQWGDRFTRDKVICRVPMADGQLKKVFAFNSKGVPICFAKRGEGLPRCQKTSTGLCGRCNAHGNKALKGINHPKATHLRTSESLPQFLQEDMRRAALDPELLSLDHELQLTDVEMHQLKKRLGTGLDSTNPRQFYSLMRQLEEKVKKGSVDEDILFDIVSSWRENIKNDATFKKMNDLKEVRRRLAETAFKREKELKQMLRHDQAMTLVSSIASTCRELLNKLVAAIEKEYILLEVRKLSIEQRKSIAAIASNAISNRVDREISDDFLMGIANKLGSLISGREARSLTLEAAEEDPVRENIVNIELENDKEYVPIGGTTKNLVKI